MAGITRTAEAVWEGTGKEGSGTLTTPSGVLPGTPYSFARRFENAPGTNPEELIAAAHAGCFAMALSFGLSKEGFKPKRLHAKAAVTIEPKDGGFAITSSALTLHAEVPGIEREKFATIVEGAKSGCPVSKVLNATVTLEWTLA
jgi:osmotically inducible protein OsmC